MEKINVNELEISENNFQNNHQNNNFQTYTTYYTTTSFPTTSEHTILATPADSSGQTFITTDDRKFIVIQPTNTIQTSTNSPSYLLNYGLLQNSTTPSMDPKPVIVNVEEINTTTPGPSSSTPLVPKKEKKPRRTIDTSVKVKIEQLKPRKGRKQKIPGQTREERKIKANTNKPYINSKGKEVQPRKFDEDFDCECPKKCTDKIAVESRRAIFNMFWKMGSFEGRCCFINSCVNESPKKRQTTKEPNKRKFSRKYYLKGNEVCKKTFCNTLKISGRTVDGSLLKAQMDDYSDMRGKAKKPNALTQEKIDEVIDHVNSFPTNGKHLVDSTLTLKKMYELYKLGRDNPVSESSYKNVFYRHFKLRFEKIKKEVMV